MVPAVVRDVGGAFGIADEASYEFEVSSWYAMRGMSWS